MNNFFIGCWNCWHCHFDFGGKVVTALYGTELKSYFENGGMSSKIKIKNCWKWKAGLMINESRDDCWSGRRRMFNCNVFVFAIYNVHYYASWYLEVLSLPGISENLEYWQQFEHIVTLHYRSNDSNWCSIILILFTFWIFFETTAYFNLIIRIVVKQPLLIKEIFKKETFSLVQSLIIRKYSVYDDVISAFRKIK